MKNIELKSIKRYLVALIGILALSNCRPDVDEFIINTTETSTQFGRTLDTTAWYTSPPATAPINQLFDELEVPATTTLVTLPTTPITGQTIELRTSDHVMISIPVNSLRTAGTTLQPTGNITFKARSCVKKGDFVRNLMPTMSFDRMLVSGGSVQVLATQNGQALTLSGNTMRIRVPAVAANTFMQIFASDSTRNVNWQRVDSSRVPFTTWLDSLRPPPTPTVLVNGYEYFSNRFQWINYDYFWDRTPIGRACVKMDTLTFNPHNTAVFAVFGNANAVMRLNSSERDLMWCSLFMPLNEPVTYITLSKVGNIFYLGTRIMNNGAGASPIVTIVPTERTLPEIIAFLATL